MCFVSFFYFFRFSCLRSKGGEHRHSGERNRCSAGRGEAGHRVGKQTPRHRGRECRGCDGLGRLNPAIGNEEACTDTKKQSLHLRRERENCDCLVYCLTAVCDHIIFISLG